MAPKTRIIAASVAVVLLLLIGGAVWLHLDTGHGPVAAHLAALHRSSAPATAAQGETEQESAAGSTDTDALTRARRGVAALGSVWNAATRAETVRLYADVHRAREWPGLLPTETLSYGPHAQQTLTLWRPEQEFTEPSLVLLFLHGDGIDGDSQILAGSDGLMFSHLGRLAATFGGIGVLANYRTDAASTAESGAEDLRLVLEWIRAHVSPWGGDPDTVIVLANSQGATLAARYLFDESVQLADGPGIAAAILSSGQFGTAAPDLRSLIERYEGEAVPLALWMGSFDTAEIKAGVAELYAQVCRRYSQCPTLTHLYGHNHLSHILSLGTEDRFEFQADVTSPMQALIGFYHTVR